MKDAGKIALLAILGLLQSFAVAQIKEVRADLHEFSAMQSKQAVVIGSLVTWARPRGYVLYRE